MRKRLVVFIVMSMIVGAIFATGLQSVSAVYVTPMVVCGEQHTIALSSDGTVWAWGANTSGQLGDGTTTQRETPVQVSELSGVTAIATRDYHTVALKNDGTVWAWGWNGYGQLGDGTTTNRNSPVQVSGISGVTAIAAGYSHTVALKSDGTVWAWGDNGYGRLGDGTTTNRNTPVQVSGISGVIAIAAGAEHTVALKNDGTVWAWGWNGFGQLGDGATTWSNTPVQVSSLSGVKAITAGDYHTIAVKGDGAVWAWGGRNNTPVQVSGLSGVATIAAGYDYTVAVKSNGTVWAWGVSNTPVQVSGLSGVIAIGVERNHTIALKGDGTVWGWGSNEFGQLGIGPTTNITTPIQVSELSGVTAIAVGSDHTVALKSDGTIWGWGSNSSGELGKVTATVKYAVVPIQVDGLSGVTAIAVGGSITAVVKSDGTVWTLGANGYGQLGDGTTWGRSTPVWVRELSGVIAIAGGDNHTVALKSDGTVWAWGYNIFGQLGDGTTTQRNTPVQVSGLSGVTAIAAGGEHTVALKSDGTVWALGANGYGQLGDGTRTSRNTPVQVSGISGVTAIVAGDEYTVALKSDGTVWAWGYNIFGQLGDGTTTMSNTPVQVSGLSGVKAISAGRFHTVALKNDTTVWAWGRNQWGQLGVGTYTNSNTPVQVSGLSGVTAIGAGQLHTVALKSDTTVQTWGNNDCGQLGIGLYSRMDTPIEVKNFNLFNLGSIDKAAPTIALTPSTTTWTNQDITVTVVLYGTGGNIVEKKWAAGNQLAAYFATGGTDISESSFVVSENGTYTVYAKDEAGNEAVQRINITNIDKITPSVPTGLKATSATGTSISFAWDASTDNTCIDGYEVYRNGERIASTPENKYTNVYLTPNKSYTYTVKAYDATGNYSDASAPLTASTLPDTQAPSIPTGLTATNVTERTVTLQWNASTDNVALYGYAIYCNGTRINTAFNTEYVFKNLLPNTSYTFGVVAIDLAPNYSNMSEPLTVLTLPDTQPPTAPTNLRETGSTETSISFAWDASTDNVWVAGYDIYRNGVKIGSTPGITFTSIPLTPNKSYTFTVKAYDAAGNYSDASAPLTASTPPDTQAPSIPTGLTVTNVTERTVTLQWNASTDNVALYGYAIYRNGIRINTAFNTEYVFKSLLPNTSYTLGVVAIDTVPNYSNMSEPLTVLTLPDTQAPTAPTNIRETGSTETSISFAWDASTDNLWIAGYDIYRDGAKIGSTPRTTFTSIPLSPNRSYTFTVKAYDPAGNYSDMSETLTALTLASVQPTPPPSDSGDTTIGDTSTDREQ